jgi:hypothetical protein
MGYEERMDGIGLIGLTGVHWTVCTEVVVETSKNMRIDTEDCYSGINYSLFTIYPSNTTTFEGKMLIKG